MATEPAKSQSFDQAFDSAFDKAVEEDKTPEQSVEDKGDTSSQDAEQQSEQTDKAAGQVEETAETDEEVSFLSKKEREELFKANPELKKGYKALMKAYTPKTQELAEKRKEAEAIIEEFAPFRDLLQAYKDNPEETVRTLARNHGLTLADTKAATKEGTEDIIDRQLDAMAERLSPFFSGNDPKETAKQFAQNMRESILEIAGNIADQKVKPIKEHQEALATQSQLERAENDFKIIDEKYPDWKDHEPKIVELMKIYQPAIGSKVSPVDYFGTIYKLATMDQSKAASKDKLVDDLKKMATNAEPQTQSVKESIVSKTPPESKSFDDAFDKAFEAAKKGEKWET